MRAPVLRSDQSGKSLPEKPAPLADRFARSGGVESKFVRRFIQETIAIIEEGLRRDGVVKIHHFGTFRLHQSQESKIGATMNIPGRSQVVFQPDKKIRELVQLALGPKIPAGSRVSLQALLEKHLTLTALPVAPEREAPIQRVVDMVETLPKPTTTFSIAEDAAEAPMPLDEKLIGMDTSSQLVPNVKNEDDANAGFSLGEAIPEAAGEQSPTFAFDDNGAEPEPIFSEIETQPELLFPRASRRQPKRFAWYAGATAVFLLLLLFVLSGKISERQGNPGSAPAPSPVAASALPVVETTASLNDNTKVVNTASESPAPFFAGGSHRVAIGDNLWGLSGAYYRDHYLWPNIYRANTAKIKNPDVLQLDQALELPVLYGPPEKLTAADRRHLAEGYFLLYRYYKENASSLAPYALWAAVRYDVRIQIEHMAELADDDLAFLQAHAVRRQMAER